MGCIVRNIYNSDAQDDLLIVNSDDIAPKMKTLIILILMHFVVFKLKSTDIDSCAKPHARQWNVRLSNV